MNPKIRFTSRATNCHQEWETLALDSEKCRFRCNLSTNTHTHTQLLIEAIYSKIRTHSERKWQQYKFYSHPIHNFPPSPVQLHQTRSSFWDNSPSFGLAFSWREGAVGWKSFSVSLETRRPSRALIQIYACVVKHSHASGVVVRPGGEGWVWFWCLISSKNLRFELGRQCWWKLGFNL